MLSVLSNFIDFLKINKNSNLKTHIAINKEEKYEEIINYDEDEIVKYYEEIEVIRQDNENIEIKKTIEIIPLEKGKAIKKCLITHNRI